MLKTLLKLRWASWWSTVTRSGRNGKKRGIAGKIGLGFLMLYVVACFLIMFGMLFESICLPLGEAGLRWFYFAVAAIMAFMLSFIGNVFATQSQLYEATDNELLLSMPIAPKFILGSRMISLLGLDLFHLSFVMIPAGVVYARHYPVSVLGAIYYVIECILLALLVQAFSCIIAWLISMVSARMRRKNVIASFLSVAFLCLYFYGYSQIQSIISSLIANGAEIATAVRKAAFTAYYFGVGVAEQNLTYLLLYTVCTLAPFELVYLILSRSFISITTKKRGASKIEYQEKSLKVRGVRHALLGKELAHFWSNSMYVLNAGMGLILLLILSVVALIKRDYLQGMFLSVPGGGEFLGPMVTVMLCGVSATVLIAAPSVSLEGKNLWLAQSFPLRARDILLAKAEMQIVLALPVILLAALAFSFALGIGAKMTFLIILVSVMFNVFYALFGVIVSLHHPKFDYVNEAVAVKQGVSTIICMFSGIGIVLAGALLYALLLSGVMESDVYLLLAAAVLGVLCILLRHYLSHGAEKRFAALEAG